MQYFTVDLSKKKYFVLFLKFVYGIDEIVRHVALNLSISHVKSIEHRKCLPRN